jgi:hypothetical protein
VGSEPPGSEEDEDSDVPFSVMDRGFSDQLDAGEAADTDEQDRDGKWLASKTLAVAAAIRGLLGRRGGS